MYLPLTQARPGVLDRMVTVASALTGASRAAGLPGRWTQGAGRAPSPVCRAGWPRSSAGA